MYRWFTLCGMTNTGRDWTLTEWAMAQEVNSSGASDWVKRQLIGKIRDGLVPATLTAQLKVAQFESALAMGGML